MKNKELKHFLKLIENDTHGDIGRDSIIVKKSIKYFQEIYDELMKNKGKETILKLLLLMFLRENKPCLTQYQISTLYETKTFLDMYYIFLVEDIRKYPNCEYNLTLHLDLDIKSKIFQEAYINDVNFYRGYSAVLSEAHRKNNN